MTAWDAFILGAVQGLTEFLPVSSSGHLVLGQALLDLPDEGIAFVIAVHVATLVSVLVVYRDRVSWLALGALRAEREAWRYLNMLVVGTLPAALVGMVLWDAVEHLFQSLWAVGLGFLFTAAILVSSRGPLDRAASKGLDIRLALIIGCAQALAVAPGVSRSGATVVTALWLGVPAAEAAAFSFLLSIPAILGAALLNLLQSGGGSAMTGVELMTVSVGGLAAAVFGVLAIRMFVQMLREKTFPRFAYYVGPLGLVLLIWTMVG